MAETVKRIEAMGVPSVLWMPTVPTHARPVPETLAKALQRGQTTLPGLDARDYAALQPHAEAAFARVPQVRAVAPGALLCPEGRCIADRDGQALYKDDDHLSPAGARYVATLFEPILSELLTQPHLAKTNAP